MRNHTSHESDARLQLPGLDIQSPVGEGTFGVVYRAVHRTLGRDVAVKVLRAPCPNWPREPQALAALQHPNVVTVHDAGRADGRDYVVMEYLPGGSLRSRLTADRPYPEARRVLASVASALEAVHGRGLLHLDLKPENVLFGPNGEVKVADFGLASEPGGSELAEGRFSGTIDYAAPELRSGRPPDARADVFGLATMAYELLTGRLPGRVFVPATRHNGRLPKTVDVVLRRGLARDPDERYPTVAAFTADLDAAFRSRRRLVPLALGLLVLGGVALALMRPTAVPSWSIHAADDGSEVLVPGATRLKAVSDVPPRLGLAAWPTLLPVLAVQPGRPLVFAIAAGDRTVARHWADAGRPRGTSFVRAGRFDGECLTNDLWRAPSQGVALDRGALSFVAEAGRPVVGCYQHLPSGPRAGDVVLLRYRARGDGAAQVTVYPMLPVTVPADDDGPDARRVRGLKEPVGATTWFYTGRLWVRPGGEWQEYAVMFRMPPFRATAEHRKVVIGVIGGEAWVDDIELFAWPAEGAS